MKQKSQILQESLSKIAAFMVGNELSEHKHALNTLNSILKTFQIEEVKELPNYNEDFKDHANNIGNVEKYLIEQGKNQHQASNEINDLMSKFIPTKEEVMEWKENKLDRLYQLSLASYYIKYDKNAKNILWDEQTKYGTLNLSINKAKPEKTQAQIIAQKNAVKVEGEPECPICFDNIGFKGNETKPSRENLRVVFPRMHEGKWFLQYSPYAYLKKHFVVNALQHTPMKIDNNTIKNLLTFLSENNEYFIGTNADLPIVGGSLLGHNHFQGGAEELPVMGAKEIFQKQLSDKVKLSVVRWPLSTIKFSSESLDDIILNVNEWLEKWRKFRAPGVINKNNNSVTYICNFHEGKYNVWMILRNNSTTTEQPYGVFHVKEKRFNIKQENIGLMEAGGLAILPKRLESEFIELIDKIKNGKNIEDSKHYLWLQKYGYDKDITMEQILKNVSDTFLKCLEDCGVLSEQELIDYVKEQ
ncbi:DUF4922 domain-containing protein [Mycoplasma todarodis]|uniref:Uncharacterized protein n=1 Tax=Mycoplasma todarodis TaxID=1937191 RepID=A0A4R0XT15_9MOLU|nr:DUF4922 domain-containing protein [Mycoplasma todarodis]TCG11600.1 hypothetical protein C4B25_01305 [Mycoplasma todarodis]